MNGLALCTGSGMLEEGVRLALDAAGQSYRTVCYIEREAYAAATLVARMEDKALDQAPVWDDVKTFRGRRWRGCVDIITGGYPCQPFSVAGRRRGAGDPRHLWPDIARIVAEVRPSLCFFENVLGHLRLGFGEVRAELRSMGFRIAAGIFSAAEVGASHKRERLFILAHRQGGGQPGLRLSARPGAARRGTSDADGVGEDLADAEGREWRPKPGQGRPWRNGLAEPSIAVEDAEHAERRARQSCGHVADRKDAGWRQAPSGAGTSSQGLSLFAPGPGNLGQWRDILAINPALEPAICRDAHGMAHRVDRLRLTGNGVVPLQAAYAFCALGASLAPEGASRRADEPVVMNRGGLSRSIDEEVPQHG